jgi:hypothetical protein
VKKLNVGERDRFEAHLGEKNGNRSIAVIHGCFDERGIPIFDREDKAIIDQMDADLIDPLVQAFLRINRYTAAEQERVAKNLNGQSVSS